MVRFPDCLLHCGKDEATDQTADKIVWPYMCYLTNQSIVFYLKNLMEKCKSQIQPGNTFWIVCFVIHNLSFTYFQIYILYSYVCEIF